MPRRWFRLSIRDDVLRTMTRQQYRAAMSYLRRCARIISEHLPR